jgi:hypothetical protein
MKNSPKLKKIMEIDGRMRNSNIEVLAHEKIKEKD